MIAGSGELVELVTAARRSDSHSGERPLEFGRDLEARLLRVPARYTRTSAFFGFARIALASICGRSSPLFAASE